MRIALGVEYDGSPFCGWQSQRDLDSVQSVLESALAKIAGHPVKLVGAGRTDAGVHAWGQVAHFDTETKRPLTAWVRGTNAYLPSAVSVRWAYHVPDYFHARFEALSRQYHYYLLNQPIRPTLYRDRAGWYHRPLQLGIMQQAADFLLGRHDFSAFCSSECQSPSRVRYLQCLNITQQGSLFLFDIKADAFLHHMVRNIVACLVDVGSLKHSPEWVQQVLRSRDRAHAAPTFAPQGLYLRRVEYEPIWGLPDEGHIPSDAGFF